MALREMEHTCSLANCVFTCEQVWCAVLGQQSLFGGVNFCLGRCVQGTAPFVCVTQTPRRLWWCRCGTA